MLRQLDLPKLFAVIALIGVFAMAVRVPASPDMWWHLRCGEVQWRTRSVLRSDVFSHTAAGTPWVNQSWLPQLAMYGLYAIGGFPALSLAVAGLVTVTFALVLLNLRSGAGSGPFWRALVVLWAAISTGRVWAPRPHLVTFALTAAWAYILDRHRRRGGAKIGSLWLLPPLMLLWANSHGGYVIGLALLAIEIGGHLLEALWARRFDGLWPRVRPLALAFALCTLATLLNPQGIRLLLFPFQTLGSAAQQNLVAEWASPDFHAADMLPFLALLLATWSALLCERKIAGVVWLRMVGLTMMALRSGRYIGLCAVAMAPVLFEQGASCWSRLRMNWGDRPPVRPPARNRAVLNWAILLLLLAAAGIKAVVALDEQTIAAVHEQIFPKHAAAYLQSHKLPQALFNDYGWGGYLIWERYPDTPVFIDGRADPYGDELIEAYRRAITAQPGWDDLLERYQVHTALIPADSALASVMHERVDWHEVYVDSLAAIYVRE